MDAHAHHHHFNLRTTGQIMRLSYVSFVSSIHTFLFISLLLFSFRLAVQVGVNYIDSYLQEKASVKSLIYRFTHHPLHSESFNSPFSETRHRHHRKRQAFLYMRPIGGLDNELSDEVVDSFPYLDRVPFNISLLRMGKFDEIWVLGVRRHAIVFSGRSDSEKGTNSDDEDHALVLQLFGRSLNLSRRDVSTLLSVICLLCFAYCCMILGFVFVYSSALGIVLTGVVNSLLHRHHPFLRIIFDGCRLGGYRLLGLVLLHWAVRDALAQLLGISFFSDIRDELSLFKLFIWLKLLAFSALSSAPLTSPVVLNFDISRFSISWVVSDVILSFVSSVNCWVACVDTRRTGQQIFKEGCYLISLILDLSVRVKCFEIILCGPLLKQIFYLFGGSAFALFIQSVAEVYFMVAWLIVYLSARAKDAELHDLRFGRSELADMINGIN